MTTNRSEERAHNGLVPLLAVIIRVAQLDCSYVKRALIDEMHVWRLLPGTKKESSTCQLSGYRPSANETSR